MKRRTWRGLVAALRQWWNGPPAEKPVSLREGAMRSFEDAFDDHVGSGRGTCACGRIFVNGSGGWDFEEGEIEALERNPSVTWLDYSVSFISFEGSTYVSDCECWKPRARRIAAFLIGHDREIAEFLTLERKRITALAEQAPTVY